MTELPCYFKGINDTKRRHFVQVPPHSPLLQTKKAHFVLPLLLERRKGNPPPIFSFKKSCFESDQGWDSTLAPFSYV